MQKILFHIKNLKLVKKIQMISFAVAFILCLTNYVFSQYIFGKYDRKIQDHANEIMELSIVDMEEKLDEIRENTLSFVTNTTIQEKLPFIQQREDTLHFQENAAGVYQVMTEYYYQNSWIEALFLILSDYTMEVGRNLEKDQEMQLWLGEGMEDSKGKERWFFSREDKILYCIREIRRASYGLESLGYVVFKVDTKEIFEQKNGHSDSSIDIQIEKDGKTVYGGMKEEEICLYGNGFAEINGKKYMVMEKESAAFPWSYSAYISYDQVSGSLSLWKKSLLLVTVGLIVISLPLGSFLARGIDRDFAVLVQKTRLFRKEIFTDCGLDGYSGRTDEIGYVHQNFDQMVHEIRQLVEDNYVKQLLLKEARYKALEKQVNPHFLYNVLQTVNWLAKKERVLEISVISEALGKYLRYSLSQKDVVTLREELDMVRNYISIQKIRYEDRLEYCIKECECFLTQKLPKMTIQVLLENSIVHALENMLVPCRITISCVQSGNSFSVQVEDNGPGIDEDILEKLRSERKSSRGLGIGLLNIQERIQILYSEIYGLHFQNTGHGTRVSVCLPYEED